MMKHLLINLPAAQQATTLYEIIRNSQSDMLTNLIQMGFVSIFILYNII